MWGKTIVGHVPLAPSAPTPLLQLTDVIVSSSPLLSSLVPAVPSVVSSTLVMPNGTFVKGVYI